MISKVLKHCLPFIVLSLLLVFLWHELFHAKPQALPSTLIGKNLPAFHLPDLLAETRYFTSQQMQGKVSLLNVWASWCDPCLNEHAMLMKIKNQYHIPIFAILYKDNRENVLNWLQKNGNPFLAIGEDTTGDTAIDLGVFGTPETFILNQQGRIVYRHIGMIDQTVWDHDLYPLIKKLSLHNE